MTALAGKMRPTETARRRWYAPGPAPEVLAPMQRKRIPLEDRFWPKVVEMPNGCWEWQGTRNQAGYGRVYFDGGRRSTGAHRVAYELVVGKIPDGLVIDHLCRNPPCVNPAHLEPVTGRENIMRGISIPAQNARKTHCLNGHPLSGDNLIIKPNGRHCRACKQADDRVPHERGCGTYARHWFAVLGTRGVRSPMCVRCGIPNPYPLSDEEWAKLDAFEGREAA